MTMATAEQAEQRKDIQPTYGYYRQPNGWITVSPMTVMEELKYRQRGWTPLPAYGRFDMSTEYAVNNPLETLLMQGGTLELCAEQIIQMALHMNPPLIPVCRKPFTQFHKEHGAACFDGAKPAVFPQIMGMDLSPLPCRFCDREFPTTQARNQHEGVAHQAEKGEIRTGETLAEALKRGLPGAFPSAPVEPDASADSLLTRLAAQMEAMQRELVALRGAKAKRSEAAARGAANSVRYRKPRGTAKPSLSE